MSDSSIAAGADLAALKAVSTPYVAGENVITNPGQKLARNNNTGSYTLDDLDLVEGKPEEQPKSKEGSGYTAPYQDLVYRYVEDPLDKGIGMASFQFDSITQKMANLLEKREINDQNSISMQQLKDTLQHPDLAKRFTENEIKSLNLMASQALRLIDTTKLPPISPLQLLIKDLPWDKILITKDSVDNVAKKMGHLLYA